MFCYFFHYFWNDKRILNKLFIHRLNHLVELFIRILRRFLESKLKAFRVMSMGDDKHLMILTIYWDILGSEENISFVD